MPRFYIDPSQAKEGIVFLNPKESRHASSVLRLEVGDAVDLIDGKGGAYSGIVATIEKGKVSVLIQANSRTIAPSGPKASLAVSVIKPERMELLVQKACELGVYAIHPLISERCVIKLSRERWTSKVERWHKIAMESCKQCGRASVPVIHAPQIFKTFMEKEIGSYDLLLIPTLVKEGKGLYHILNSQKAENALIFIGPEGDFTKSEVELAVSAGAKPVDLGPLVMRSETAAMAALAVIQFMMREAKHV